MVEKNRYGIIGYDCIIELDSFKQIGTNYRFMFDDD